MASHPASPEVAAALGAFCTGGAGPTHTKLTSAFARCGYGDIRPYEHGASAIGPNKETRIRETVEAAAASGTRALDLVEAILVEFRVFGFFDGSAHGVDDDVVGRAIVGLRGAISRSGWELLEDGSIQPTGLVVLGAVADRPAIEAQLVRLRGSVDDPALLLGTAKELLETTAKHVLEVFSVPYTNRTSFDELWYHARDRLGLLPESIDTAQPGGTQMRKLMGATWIIASMAHELRNQEGTGHGRTLPTGVTAELAMFVVREACSVAELCLSTLDRMTGK